MSPLKVTAYFGLAVFLFACGTSKKAVRPAETAARSLPALPVSRINIPVKIYMKPLLMAMDSTTSKSFTNTGWPNYTQTSCDFRYKYLFNRSPFTFLCVNNRVTISFGGQYQIAGSRCVCAFDKQVSPWVSGSCGFGNEPMRRVNVRIASQLELLPNHQMRTTTHIDQLQAYDKCNVTILQNDITTEVMDSIKASVETYCSSFDNFVQTVNNNSFLSGWRRGGSRVMPLCKYGYLNLNPVYLQVGRFNTIGDTLVFSMGFTGTPLFSSDSDRLVTGKPLPSLSNTDMPPGIEAYLDATYDYPFFNSLLNDSLRNKPFEVEGRTFVIKDVHVGGTNDGKIQVDVRFTGNRSGVLHLSGTPVLDTASQVLTMPDISFDIDTRDMMVNIAKGLIRKKIMKELKGQSVFDIAALIQKNKALIDARLSQSLTTWMSSKGNIQDIRILGILPQEDHIQLQVLIKANLVLTASPTPSLLYGF